MPQPDLNIFPNKVPDKHQHLVDRFRAFLNDFPEMNELLEEKESSDLNLYRALIDAWQEINFGFDPTDLHYRSIEKVPSWATLQLGATLQVLVSQGILSARNVLSFNDSGGIQIKNNDKFGRYTVFFNMLIAKYSRQVQAMKRATNINAGYGGVHSPYNDILS